MKLTPDRIDALVAGLAKVRDDDLDAAGESPGAEALFAQIVSAPAQGRRRHARARRRRIGALALLGALTLTGGGAAATLLFGSEEQATAEIACYQTASAGARSVVQKPSTGLDPVALCHRELAVRGQPESSLVACAGKDIVAVIPGRTAADCTRSGFAALGADYERYRARLERLEKAVLELEAQVDCLPPAELAAKVQQLLDSRGWQGWTTRVRSESSGYPCGSVTTREGDDRRTLAGALDGDARVVRVHDDWARSVDELLYGESKGVQLPLQRRSAATCLTTGQITELVDRAIAPADLRARLVVTQPEAGVEIEDPRGARYAAGCSVVGTLRPARDPAVVVLTVYRKG